MDKGSLKVFAIEARRDLISKVKNRLEILGITSGGIDKSRHNDFLKGNILDIGDSRYSKESYNNLIKKYESIGYEQLIEESAYTWFNRLVALAYMEANGYIDEKMVFSNGSKIEPGIIDEYYEANFFENMSKDEQEKLHNLRDKHKSEEMYTLLIEEKCNELNKIMPFMFDKKGGYSDILFPAGLLTSNSILIRLREEFEKAKEENEEREKVIPVEIIGWLYQYYNQDKRDLIFDSNMSNRKKIKKLEIPAATQIFTPHWIVKYMAENSLGKLAIENLKVSPELKRNWKYYIDREIDSSSERLNIEDIKIIDPSMGSGHMLTYCFDMLYEIYEDLGWSRKDAVLSILKNNLYGLEIDKRAGQLASFAIMMKGREKFPRLLKVLEKLEEDEKFELNTLWIDESNRISEGTRAFLNENKFQTILQLLENFDDAKEYGSILKLTPVNIAQSQEELESFIELYKRRGQLTLLTPTNQLDFSMVSIDFKEECKIIKKLIQQQKIMSDSYDVTITNPPYMGNGRMNDKLKNYINNYYQDVKSDLFAVFIKKCYDFSKNYKFISLVTPYVWWFIKSYEELRYFVLNNMTFDTIIQLEYNAFEGACIPVGTFILRKGIIENHKIDCIRLADFKGIENQPIKTLEAIENPNCGWRYTANQKEFEKIPGSPIAYWVSDKIRNIFIKGKKLELLSKVRKGMDTGNNDIFMRYWYEVNKNKSEFSLEEKNILITEAKWFPYNKGGSFRKWYGNQEFVINWENNGFKLKNFKNSNLRSKELYFKECLSWTLLSSSNFGLRYYPNGFIFDSNGSSIFLMKIKKLFYM